MLVVLGLLQHALIEFEERQFAIDVELGGVQVAIVHAISVTVPR